MAACHAFYKLAHLTIFAAFLICFIETQVHQGRDKYLIYAFCGQNTICRRAKYSYHPVKYSVVQWNKHGKTTIALPAADQAFGLDIYILVCGDVHPLPGPTFQAAEKGRRVCYTAGQLKRLRKYCIRPIFLTLFHLNSWKTL